MIHTRLSSGASTVGQLVVDVTPQNLRQILKDPDSGVEHSELFSVLDLVYRLIF
jgi:hypothetical protein